MLLLEKDLEPADGGAPIIPAEGDFNTLKWILQLGLGDDDDRDAPVMVRGELAFLRTKEVAAGDKHTLFVTDKGRLFVVGEGGPQTHW